MMDRLEYHRRLLSGDNTHFSGYVFRNYLLKTFLGECRKRESVRVLDYGSGRARYLFDPTFNSLLHSELQGKLQSYYCYDPGSPLYEEPPAAGTKFDIIVCAGSLDRVEERDLDSEIARLRNWCAPSGVVLLKMRHEMPGEDNNYVTPLSVSEWTKRLNQLERQYHFIYIEDFRRTA